ncbi:ABC transporter substrate-binding protein [Bordetella petrii]|nr:ABC transporter substrate-binding protein [Bordetella petrii]
MDRRTFNSMLLGGAAASILGLPRAVRAAADGTLRIAMTLSDVPTTTGQANQGTEGVRFISNSLYDGLIRWDLTHADRAATLVPGLAESWTVDSDDPTRWQFKLRQNVRFHDGSLFDADAVIWNLDKLLNKESAQFDQAQAIQATPNTASIASYRKIDDQTVEIQTRQPDSVQLYYLAQVFMSSPKHWHALGGSWAKFAEQPSGTGPFKLTRLVPRDRAEMVPNADYWNPDRVPEVKRLVLMCMPDSNTRVAALLSGQIDWAEAPAPDALPRLKSEDVNVVTNIYPHIWPYAFSLIKDSPFHDVRVRQAANLGVDRDSIVQLLGGTAMAAKGMVDPKHPWFGKPNFDIRYAPDEARRLMKEAGYGPDKLCAVKVATSPSGSGQMQPLPMNEFIQSNLREVYFDVQFEVLDWETLRARRRFPASAPENRGTHALNQAWAYWDPNIGLLALCTPGGYNWSEYNDPQAQALAKAARHEFDPAKQQDLLAQLHSHMVDQAMWLWVVHDLNPRALSPKVEGFVQAQNWFLDLTPVHVA